MQAGRTGVADAHRARGIAVVIDVIRAFSVTAYGFHRGVARFLLVRTVDEAFRLQEYFPGALLAGEVDGRSIPGFDLNNSPATMGRADVHGRVIIQRTGSGTQGAVGAGHCEYILACSLVNARATAIWIRQCARVTGLPITLIPTASPDDRLAVEDGLCADYVEHLLGDPEASKDVLVTGIEELRESGRFTVFEPNDSDFPSADVPAFLDIDRFSFVMRGKSKELDGITYVDVMREDV